MAYAPLLIVLIGIATYWNALHAPFVWDDNQAILQNTSIQQLSTALNPPPHMPLTQRAVTNFTLAVNYALGGLDVFGYHVGNLAIHMLAALVLFGIVRRTLSFERFGETFRGVTEPLALLAALWWVVHPLTTEMVDYVTQRSEALMGLCLFTTLYTAIRALSGRHRGFWTGASIGVSLIGMWTKETMLIAPMVVIAYDCTVAFSGWRDAVRARKGLYAALTIVAVGAFTFGSLWYEPDSLSGTVHPWTYLLNQMRIIPRYFELVVFPLRLVLDYGDPPTPLLADVAWGAVLVMVVAAASVVCLIRRPAFGFLGLAFWLALGPTSSILPIATEVGAERRMYVPLAACSVALFTLGWLLLRRYASRVSPAAARRATIGAIALSVTWVAALAVRTGFRNDEYNHPAALWRTSVERWPHGRVRFTYAMELATAGDHAGAVPLLEQAVEDYPRARFALATELVSLGNLPRAIDELRHFIRDAPPGPATIPARLYLARVLVESGQRAEAADQLHAVLAINPRELDANASLGDLMRVERRYVEAIGFYETFLSQESASANVLLNLGLAQASAGRREAAVESLRRGLGLKPQSIAGQRALANLLVELGRPAEAESAARAVVELEPRNPEGHNLLGLALVARGALAEALDHFREAVALDPTFTEAGNNAARAERLLQR